MTLKTPVYLPGFRNKKFVKLLNTTLIFFDVVNLFPNSPFRDPIKDIEYFKRKV